jgi:hypothetical protein
LSLEKLSETTLNGYLFGIDFEEIVGVDISTGEKVLTASQATPYNAEPVVAGDYVVMPNEGNSLIGYQINTY